VAGRIDTIPDVLMFNVFSMSELCNRLLKMCFALLQEGVRRLRCGLNNTLIVPACIVWDYLEGRDCQTLKKLNKLKFSIPFEYIGEPGAHLMRLWNQVLTEGKAIYKVSLFFWRLRSLTQQGNT